MRKVVIVVCCMTAATGAPSGAEAATFSDEAVEAAIKKGVEFLWSQQGSDGGWPAYSSYPLGPTALATYALLESGVDVQDSRMAAALRRLAEMPAKKTYTLGIRANVWLAAMRKDRRYGKLLRQDVALLIRSGARGSYHYNCTGRPAGSYDNSCSQYGILGVWAGQRATGEVPQKYWMASLRHWHSQQNAEGGWAYKAGPGTRATMTAAGLASLFICYDNLLRDAKAFIECRVDARAKMAQRPIRRGMEWFGRNFTSSLGQKYYYLYGVERVGLASGHKYFGKADWYKLGAATLLAGQEADGSWKKERHPLVDTAFALLFLVRGRNAVLFNKLEFPGDWNNRPRDLATVTRWISRVFERTVNWQIINLEVPVSEWHDAPILYISGARAPKFTDEHLARLRQFVYQGGTIFSVTEGKGQGFKEHIREVYRTLFPKYPLKPCPDGHPLLSARFRRLPTRVRFFTIDNGVRPLVVHTDEDLSLHWQLNHRTTKKWAFEAATNVFMYVTDKATSLRRRGTTTWPDRPVFTPQMTVRMARLRYRGNDDPEPLAYERFARLMGHRRKTKVEIVGPIAIPELSAAATKLAVLVGTASFSLTDAEVAALAKFIRDGGTLFFDAAGGDPGGEDPRGFVKSVEALAPRLFPQERLGLLASSSALYRMKGMQIEKVRWRRATMRKLAGIRRPLLRAVMVDERPAVILSREDISGALLGCGAYSAYGYHPGTMRNPGPAFRLMRNIILYAHGVR